MIDRISESRYPVHPVKKANRDSSSNRRTKTIIRTGGTPVPLSTSHQPPHYWLFALTGRRHVRKRRPMFFFSMLRLCDFLTAKFDRQGQEFLERTRFSLKALP
jgi:hypothetical protein